MATYTLQYPPSHDDTYVKATTKRSTSYWPYFATDPAKSLTGGDSGNEWMATNGTLTNQRFHIDLGSVKIIRGVYYENHHNSGTNTDQGARHVTMQGSNVGTAFAELTYATNTDWTDLTISASEFDQHSASNATDPKYFTVTNQTAYRYYAFKIADNWGNGTYLGIRRLVLQTQDDFGGSVMIWSNE